MRKKIASAIAAVSAAALVLGACVSTGVDTVEDFRSSIEGGADCNELFDQRTNFESEADLEQIDEELEKIGCEDRDSERNDR